MKLFLECKPDETLAVALGVLPRSIVHSHGKGRLSRHIRDQSGVTGLVDEDPGSAEPVTLGQFLEVSMNHDVILKVRKSHNSRLVVICPRLEPWLIKTAKAATVNMDTFNLSDNLQDLDAEINHRLPNLERLLTELVQAKSPRLLYLKSLLVEQ